MEGKRGNKMQIEIKNRGEGEKKESVIDDRFIGLALDESNQDNETPDRIKAWIEEIKPLFN